jgi:hypothetical protein
MGQLREEIAIVASLLPCKTVWITVESSQRADPVIRSWAWAIAMSPESEQIGEAVS